MADSRKQRRALSTVRTGGPIDRGGDPQISGRLAAALSVTDRDENVAQSFTHGFHAYPARMHPATARALMDLALDGWKGKRPPVVLDPFCGSGTVLVEARRVGARARGVDANPLAVLIARAKTAVGRPAQRLALRDTALHIADDVTEQGKQARRAGGGKTRERAPRGVDATARQRQLAHWFSPHVRRELEALAGAIDRLKARERDVLRAVLSSIIYKCSKRESDTSTEKVARNIARGAPARWFAERAVALVDGLDALGAVSGPNVGVARGDARALAKVDIDPASVDAIVTSPPYAGTYDYLEHQSLRYAFLGLGSSTFARDEIGSRRAFKGDVDQKLRAMKAWERDLAAALAQMHEVLRPGGVAVVVMGDSLAGSRAVYADRTLERAAPRGLEQVAIASQQRPTFGAVEGRAFERAGKREHIVWYRKR